MVTAQIGDQVIVTVPGRYNRITCRVTNITAQGNLHATTEQGVKRSLRLHPGQYAVVPDSWVPPVVRPQAWPGDLVRVDVPGWRYHNCTGIVTKVTPAGTLHVTSSASVRGLRLRAGQYTIEATRRELLAPPAAAPLSDEEEARLVLGMSKAEAYGTPKPSTGELDLDFSF